MKILQIIYSLAPGGAERFVVDLSNELSKQQNEVYLCVLRDDSINNQGFYKKEIDQNVNYINLNLAPGLKLSNIIHLLKIIRRIKPDIVHCHQNLVNYIFPLVLLFKKTIFFHTIHNDAPKEVSSKFEYHLRCVFYKTRKVQAITISAETSMSFKRLYKTNKYIEIYNGRKRSSQSNDFELVKEYTSNLRKKYNTIFLHIARFAYQKNQNILINTFTRLNEKNHNVALIIIGSGFDSPDALSLKHQAPKNVLFLGEKHNVTDYFLNSDAFCLSSLHEGMPITLIEALSCGCIPICTPVGGIKNTIENEVTGFLSKTTDEDDYFQSILNFLNNRNVIKKENLVKYYNENFCIEKCATMHINAFSNKIIL